MNRLAELAARRRGAIFHAVGALLVFVFWRMAGMPLPGTLGRLIPLAWLITAIISGREDVPPASPVLLGSFLLLSLFWASAPPMFLIASSCGLAALFPGLLSVSRRDLGLLMALVPLVPMILVQVPFTGDEPHYSRITESLFPGDRDSFSSFAGQSGDTAEGISHHQSLYPALMLPGYPFGVPGLRLMNLVFALAGAAALSLILRDSGCARWRELSFLGLLLIPGSSILGLVYPGWLAVAVFLISTRMVLSGGRRWWAVAAAAVLVLIKVRFVGLSLGIFAALVMEEKGRKRWLLLLSMAGLALGGVLLDLVLLGGRVFWARYGNEAFLITVLVQPLYRLPDMAVALFSTLLDAESGLLWKAPWVLASLAGLPVLRRQDRRLFRWLGLPALFYLLFLIYWTGTNWSGVPTPSGRMLLPLLPLLAVSLGKVFERKGVRLLLLLSLAMSALYFCHPVLRFNYADGTDALFSRLAGSSSGLHELLPVAVRFRAAVFALWTLPAAAIAWFIYRKCRYTEYAIGACMGLLFLLGGTQRATWQAEDIPASMRDNCRVYPRETEPESRKYWVFSRERMLLMNGDWDRIRLPLPNRPGDSARVEISFRAIGRGTDPGITVRCGGWSDSLFAESEIMDPPTWMTLIRDVDLEKRPENMSLIRWTLMVPVMEDTMEISPLRTAGPDGRYGDIYLDEVNIR